MKRLDAFEAYQAATGAVMDWTTFMLKITNEQYANLESLFFNIGNVRISPVPTPITSLPSSIDGVTHR